jgi:hypothetical protein
MDIVVEAIVYTYSEARQNLASLLEKAAKEGEVRIKRKDGQIFVVKPQPQLSPGSGGRSFDGRA